MVAAESVAPPSPPPAGPTTVQRASWAAVACAPTFGVFLLIKIFDGALHAPFNPFFPIYVAERLGDFGQCAVARPAL